MDAAAPASDRSRPFFLGRLKAGPSGGLNQTYCVPVCDDADLISEEQS